MTGSERLLDRLRTEAGLVIPAGATIRRTYAGWIQRQQGAWSWYVVLADGREINPPIGSAETIAELLKAPSLVAWGSGYQEVGSGYR